MPPKRKINRRFFHSTSHQEHHCSTYVISFFGKTWFSLLLFFHIFRQNKGRKERTKSKQNNVIFVCLFLNVVFFLTISYPLMVLFPSKFKWWHDMSMVWIAGHCLFFPRVSTLSPLCNSCFRIWFPEIIYSDSHFDMFSRSFYFLLFLDLFISCSFISFMFKGVFRFSFFPFLFMYFHFFSFPATHFSLEQPVPNPDHSTIFDPLRFADHMGLSENRVYSQWTSHLKTG